MNFVVVRIHSTTQKEPPFHQQRRYYTLTFDGIVYYETNNSFDYSVEYLWGILTTGQE